MKKALLSLLSVVIGVVLKAQEAVETVNAEVETARAGTADVSISLVEIYKNGGFFSHLIAALLLAALVMGIYKYWQLYVREKVNVPDLWRRLSKLIQGKQFTAAKDITNTINNTSIGYIFHNGLLDIVEKKDYYKGNKFRVRDRFEQAAMERIPKLQSHILWLDIIAQVATLMGLLGTIYGLMMSFKALETALPAEQQAALTGGIQRAMGTTFMGLSVAIPTMAIKGMMQARSESLLADIDEYVDKMAQFVAESLD